MLPDLRHPKIKAKFLHNSKLIDTDPDKFYISQEGVAEEDEIVDIKVYDYVFVIDRSGSMGGPPIKLAVEALQLFLHSLPIGSKFNIVSFGSNYTKLFPQSVLYDESSLDFAQE